MTTSPRTKTDIVVVGAGPSGLVAALQLASYGVRVRIMELQEMRVGVVRVHAATTVSCVDFPACCRKWSAQYSRPDARILSKITSKSDSLTRNA